MRRILRRIYLHTIRMLFIDRHGEAAGAVNAALSGGDYTSRLERELEALFKRRAVAVCTADAAIHTALHLCGVRERDYVFVPSYTFYSYIASVVHAGGIPVFLDCDPITRCVSPSALETAFVWASLQRKMPKAVVVDNAFGSVADYDVLYPLCRAYDVPLVELCCDGVGNFNYKLCGANGDYGVIGFDKRLYGGGGALLCDDDILSAQQFTRAEYSESENHDYRMHNIIAALDCVQLDIAKKLSIRARKNLDALCAAIDTVLPPVDGDAGTYAAVKAAKFAYDLRADGYDVKLPPPVHTLSQYDGLTFFEHERGYSVCETLREYCLISMDFTAIKRIKLISKLEAYQ